ncbi:MAG: glycerol-3-phosphate dehydrogenase/oxidase, partial [Acidimicrobiia bacterium]
GVTVAVMSREIPTRADLVGRLRSEDFDVLVIGGGITGVGVALDAAARGLRTALVERDDFASGTSSKSSKLVHGGLRYLQQGEVRLVYEALHERQRLRRNAPHLVSLLPFMLPILTKDGLVSRKIARALGSALWMYDFTGGARIGRFHRRLRKKNALAHMPTMPGERLASAYVYYDAQADDARLCLEIALTAIDQGAVVLNRCGVTDIRRDGDGKAVGVRVSCDGDEFDVTSKVVVNAAGVWTDRVLTMESGADPDTIRPAKGVHVTVPWHKVRNDIAVVIPVPKDKRSLFVIPWGPRPDGTFTHTYVGTTDTDYQGPIDDPQCTKDDIDYVLRALNASVTTGVESSDVIGVWAGLRPLVKQVNAEEGTGRGGKAARTADLSRRHLVKRSDTDVISVTGGKLTTYREMAEDTVDEVIALLASRGEVRRFGRCRTRRLRLRGAMHARTDGSFAAHLESRFGSKAGEVRELIATDPDLATPLIVGLPYVRAEAVHAVTREFATTLDDVLSRRTRTLLFDRGAARAAARDVAELVAPFAGWDAARVEREVAAFLEICDHEATAAVLSESELYR